MLKKLLSIIFGVKPIELWAGQVWTANKEIKGNPFLYGDSFWTVTIDEIRDGYVRFTRESGEKFFTSNSHSISEFRKIYTVLVKESADPFRFAAEEAAGWVKGSD